MKSLPIIFAVATALCWGLYGPTLNAARDADVAVGAARKNVFKPFVAIGVAYLVLAVGGGLIGILYQGESLQFFGVSTRATGLAFAAGVAGALGALTLTTAIVSGGKAHTVMPIVFGGAVTVTALVSLVRTGSDVRAHPWLWAGIGLMIISAVIITMNTPHGPPQTKPAPSENAVQEAATRPAAE